MSNVPPADEDSLDDVIKGIGATGSVLYSCFLLVIFSRTYYHFQGGGDAAYAATRREGATAFFPGKDFFHLFLLASVILELPYYVKLTATTKASYACHLLAMWCDLTAFSMYAVTLSTRALQLLKDKEKILTYIIALDSFALIYTLVVICLVIISEDVDSFVAR